MKAKKIATYFWLLLFASSIFSVYSIFSLTNSINGERDASAREIEYFELSDLLSGASDFLTDEVRKYVITGEPRHIQDYWYEIDIRKTREKVLKRLHDLNATEYEMELLQTAKKNSDALVATEIRAMKLILVALGVPEQNMHAAIKSYELPASDLQLTPQEKIDKAREIMFDELYAKNKKSIMTPIYKFQKIMRQRVERDHHTAEESTDFILLRNILLILLNGILVLGSIWARIL